MFRILNFGHWCLPFDLAQGGELVEPFVICDLLFEIYSTRLLQHFMLPVLGWFDKSPFFRNFFMLVYAGSERLYDSGAGFSGVNNFVNRVVSRKGFAHGHDAEMLL